MSGDDWSSVIDEQTQETVVPQSEEAADGPFVSPFSTGIVQQNSGASFCLPSRTINVFLSANQQIGMKTACLPNGALTNANFPICIEGTKYIICSAKQGTVTGGVLRWNVSLLMYIGFSLAHDNYGRQLLIAVADASTGHALEFCLESVDKVLDEVRPILVADGGNVEVVSAEDGIVQLRLQVCACH